MVHRPRKGPRYRIETKVLSAGSVLRARRNTCSGAWAEPHQGASQDGRRRENLLRDGFEYPPGGRVGKLVGILGDPEVDTEHARLLELDGAVQLAQHLEHRSVVDLDIG